MRVIVIGGTGHIGGHLVPRLIEAGHDVTVATRGRRPRPDGKAWEQAKLVKLPADDPVAALAELPCDALIDIVQADATALYEALRGKCRHFIWCGSVWMLGPPTTVPAPEVRVGPALSEPYERRMDELCGLQRRCRRDGVAFTAILPPNICGPGKVPLEMRGGRDVEAHRAMARGEPVKLFRGCNALIGPCDAQDVAEGFALALEKPDPAAGEFFNVGSAYALTAAQMVQLFSEIYGVAIPIEWVSYEEFATRVMPDRGARNHFLFHMCPDISKARRKLAYEPRHTPEHSMARAVEWMKGQALMG